MHKNRILSEETKQKNRERARKWYRNNKKRALSQMKEYQSNNSQKIKEQKKCYYFKNKEITALKAVIYRRNNPDRIRKRQKEWYEKNRDYVIDKVIKYNRGQNIKRHARAVVDHAIRSGKLKREECYICGSIQHIHAHHIDYTKPMFVIWLCRKHHGKVHRKYFPTKLS